MHYIKTRSRFHKADAALLLATVSLISTITLSIFSLADGIELITPLWITGVVITGIGLLSCWFWRPAYQSVTEMVRDSCGVWAVPLGFALVQQDWREVMAFAALVIVAFRISRWLKRRQASLATGTRGRILE